MTTPRTTPVTTAAVEDSGTSMEKVIPAMSNGLASPILFLEINLAW